MIDYKENVALYTQLKETKGHMIKFLCPEVDHSFARVSNERDESRVFAQDVVDEMSLFLQPVVKKGNQFAKKKIQGV